MLGILGKKVSWLGPWRHGRKNSCSWGLAQLDLPLNRWYPWVPGWKKCWSLHVGSTVYWLSNCQLWFLSRLFCWGKGFKGSTIIWCSIDYLLEMVKNTFVIFHSALDVACSKMDMAPIFHNLESSKLEHSHGKLWHGSTLVVRCCAASSMVSLGGFMEISMEELQPTKRLLPLTPHPLPKKL